MPPKGKLAKAKVAYQGLPGAYSELAARQYFGARVATLPCPTFGDVFRVVQKGEATHGVLPIENSLAGSIHQNFDLLLEQRVHIVGELKLRVSHCLLAPRGVALSAIREVISHPQALAQCAGFIRAQRRLTATAFFDTAGAADAVARSERRDLAAIASAGAGQRYGLVALRRGIEDDARNYTRFIIVTKGLESEGIVGKGQRGGRKPHKTSIVFALRSIPGALHKSLSIFALRDIDLLKIESRPIPGKPWEYIFYLDFVTPQDPAVGARAIAHLREISEFVRVLGTYPRDLHA